MSENNGWPDPARPGAPLNPERDGWHWLMDSNQDPYLLNWSAITQRWGDYPGTSPEDLHTVIGGYCAPCLTPAEHAAALAAEYRRGQEEMRERAADIATKLSAEYANGTPKPGREHECGGMESGAASVAAAIRAAAGEAQP